MDGSDSRKNAPAAHIVLGVPHSINSGIYVGIDLIEKTLRFCPDIGPEIFTRNATKFLRGTGWEMEWKDNFICPSEFEYMAVTLEKWFGYMNVALELMQHMTKNNQDIAKVTKMLSWFYCIINDYSDFVKAEISEGKNLCDDLVEGKFSFPVIHAIKTKGNLEVFGEITDTNLLQKVLSCFCSTDMFCQRKSDIDSKFRLIEILEKEGSFEFTRNYLIELHKEMIDATNELGGNPLFEKTMNELLADVLAQKPPKR